MLQFRSPKNGVLKIKYRQIYQNFNVLKAFNMAFDHFFSLKIKRGYLLEWRCLSK